MLLCNCQGSLCIGLKAEQRTLAIVWGRQHTLAAGRRFKLIVRRWLLELVKCSRKKIFIQRAFGFIFLRRSLALVFSLFCSRPCVRRPLTTIATSNKARCPPKPTSNIEHWFFGSKVIE